MCFILINEILKLQIAYCIISATAYKTVNIAEIRIDRSYKCEFIAVIGCQIGMKVIAYNIIEAPEFLF